MCNKLELDVQVRRSLRGKRDNRPNRISQRKIDEVKEHINLFPAEPSHYSRTSNPNRLYLSATLTISEMFRQYEAWAADKGISPVSSLAYRMIFNTHFNLGFGSPRSDVCSKCEADRVEGKSSEHAQSAEAAFTEQKSDRLVARGSEAVHYITFDLQKTMPLPKLSVSKAFYLRQLWLYMGIHVISKKKEGCYFHIWTEDAGGCGVKEVLSCLIAFFQVSGISGGRLVAWSDSCGGQNKNNVMINFWQYVIATKLFSCIEHKFPEPGHNFLDSDRDFAHVETMMRRHENIYSVDEYCNILNKSSNAPKPVVTSMNDKMCDVSGIQCMRGIKKGSRNNDGNKIELRDKVRWLKVTQFGSYQYRHSFSDSEPWKEVNLRSPEFDAVLESSSFVTVVSSARHAVKKCKIQDIQKQLEFIPAIYRGYYEKVIRENTSEADHDSDMDLYDSDIDMSNENDEQEAALVCRRLMCFVCFSLWYAGLF